MSSKYEAEADEVLDQIDYDPAGKTLLIKLIAAFEDRFGFTPTRREFLAFMAEADAIAAQHTKALEN